MRLNKRKFAPTAGVSLTPMIDIVFLLVIFFMTLPQLSQVVYHPVDLPLLQKIDDDEQTQKITINLDKDGIIYVNGRSLTSTQLDSRLDSILNELGGNPNRLSILIRADSRCKSGAVNELTAMLSKFEITQIRISARSIE